jgi:DNA invertase Pin-like site-specific DNA recombinase
LSGRWRPLKRIPATVGGEWAEIADRLIVKSLSWQERSGGHGDIRELGERDIVLRWLREGIDTSNATGRMVAGVLASLAELELELGRERRAAAREARRVRGQHIGRSKVLDGLPQGLDSSYWSLSRHRALR